MASKAFKREDAECADAAEVFSTWLDRLGQLMDEGDAEKIAELFLPDAFWKDFLSLTWGFRTSSGRQKICEELVPRFAEVGIHSLRVAERRIPPLLCRRAAKNVLEGFFDFETNLGHGTGIARLVRNEAGDGQWKAWLFLTTLQSLRGFEERIGPRRQTGDEFSRNLTTGNWLDQRIEQQANAGEAPPVVIVGAGHAGLILAARLKQMGVSALVLEKDARIGDVWRGRYHSLTLHNQIFANHLPYMPFPQTWPVWLPKDKLANWLESYADAQELNVWTSSELTNAEHDPATGRWTLAVRGADGATRQLHCRNLVMSTGVSGSIPKQTSLPGIEHFKGPAIHSAKYTRGDEYAGKSVMVVGTGNSGHDIAQDLHAHGAAKIYLLQRGPTCVVSLEPTAVRTFSVYSEQTPVEDVDLLTSVIPYPILEDTYKWITKRAKVVDQEMIEALGSVGFKTFYGDDETGFHMMYLRGEGGYYIDVGCCDLIINKDIEVIDYQRLEGFSAQAAELTDGESIPCDAVIMATGFQNMQENVRKLLGDTIADKVGKIWGLDEHCHMRNMWKPTAQQGLWFMGGGLIDSRLFSRFLAIQLLADLEGLTPDRQAAA